MGEPQPEFVIRLRALPDSVPPAVRLRRALKCLLRSFGLRCVGAEPVPADALGEPQNSSNCCYLPPE